MLQPKTSQAPAYLQKAKQASFAMKAVPHSKRVLFLKSLIKELKKNKSRLLKENEKDLMSLDPATPRALSDRLKLDEQKFGEVLKMISQVAQLQNPLGQVLESRELDKGLILNKVTVPLGVIGIVFESRPDVIPQIAALCMKSANCVVMKGGKEALHTNRAFVQILSNVSDKLKIPGDWLHFLESREAFQEILQFPECVDLIVPRGSYDLVKKVMESTQIPVLGHAEGICHIYIHSSADLKSAISPIVDAKIQYPAACNSVETLLIDKKIGTPFIQKLADELTLKNVELRGCEKTLKILKNIVLATDSDFRTEASDLKVNLKIVENLAHAISHINHFGSHHTDAIFARDKKAIEQFESCVDSSCIIANASTRFADGYRFGLGAEVGISTQKTHARGPVGLQGLLTTQFRVRGRGHRVSDYMGSGAKKFTHKEIKNGRKK